MRALVTTDGIGLMDGDARADRGPDGVEGYSVHLAHTQPKPLRPEARTEPRRAPQGDDAEQRGTEQGADKGDEAQRKPTPRWKKRLYWGAGIVVALVLVIAGVVYWMWSRQFESTDDAFVDAYISQVSAQVGGRVIQLDIQDYQAVKQGEVILQLDPRDFQVRLDQAKAQRAQASAQLAQARAQLTSQQAALDQAQAQVRIAEADLWQAQTDLARYRSIDPKAVTRQQVDTATATTKSGQARLDSSRQAVQAARANIETQRAAIDAAAANVAAADVGIANAELQLSYTTLRAPRDGTIAKRSVDVGNYVNPGQALLAVVGNERWVTANFKETQLAGMRPGQHVRVEVDACPDRKFDGRVEGFQPGSGSVFSAIPTENATGNWVKVVQRVPVKIVFDDARIDGCRLAPGMSATPRVTVR